MSHTTSYIAAEMEMSGVPHGSGDEHGDPKLGWILMLLILMATLVTVGYGAIYLGVQYGTPSWGAHAYPPPLVR